MRYKHFSGYIGENNPNATLNGQFYAYFWQKCSSTQELLEMQLSFPQRVPKQGFFDELVHNETEKFKLAFDETIQKIKCSFIQSRDNLSKNKSDKLLANYLNWAKLGLRYGLSGFIAANALPCYKCVNEPELELLQAQAEVETSISYEEQLDLTNLINIINKYAHKTNITAIVKIKLFNYLIVNYYRNKQYLNKEYDILEHVSTQKATLKDVDLISIDNILISSIAYRGLAMATELGVTEQNSLLTKAESLARNIYQANILTRENLYTCLQTLSKWSHQNGNKVKAQEYLEEMIRIDPFDSTGYCELGMHLFRISDYQNAYINYQKAIELGPPGTAMFSFYCGKTMESLGKIDAAIEHYQQSIALDDQAVSPYLELIEIYTKHKQAEWAKELIKKIKNNPILNEQLEEDEIKKFEKLTA